jgi:hypothetical protein
MRRGISPPASQLIQRCTSQAIILVLALAAACSPAISLEPTEIPTVNNLETLIPDITQPHEARPHGVPPHIDWARAPRLGMGHEPGEFKAMIAWGQVYEASEGSPAVNTRVHIRKMEAYFLSKADGQWHSWQSSLLVDGAFYREDFADDINIPADLRSEPAGGISVKLTSGYNYHFWPASGRVSIDPEDIGGVFTTVQARLVVDDPEKPDDTDQARLLLSVGGDYWLSLTAPWDYWKTNGDIAIGRFKIITSEWQAFNMSTLDAATLRQNPPPFK